MMPRPVVLHLLLALSFAASAHAAPSASADPDGDGITGASDRCPQAAEDKDGFQDDDGCPDPDNDGDGYVDREDPCPDQAEDFDGYDDEDGCLDRDNDKDGVDDVKEARAECANQPEDKDGFEDDDGCPELDNDKDGFADASDLCPNEAGVAALGGCPDRDQDADQVVDRFDNCPTDAGTLAFRGCRTEQFVVIHEGRIELTRAVKFKDNKWVFEPGSQEIVAQVAEVLVRHPELGLVRVEVTPDNRGSASLNLDFARRRAEVLLKELTGRGVAAARLTTVSDGLRPVTGGRVTFVLVPSGPASSTAEGTSPVRAGSGG